MTMRPILLASLVGNLFLGSLIAGHLLISPLTERQPGLPLPSEIAAATRVLSPADLARFRSALIQAEPGFAAQSKAMRVARDHLAKDISAPVFDARLVNEDFTAWHRAWNAFIDAMQPAMVDALGQLSPDGRRKLIAARQAAVR